VAIFLRAAGFDPDPEETEKAMFFPTEAIP